VSKLKSLKADKEVVWKKLSTVPAPQIDHDLAYFQAHLWRGLRRGLRPGKNADGSTIATDEK